MEQSTFEKYKDKPSELISKIIATKPNEDNDQSKNYYPENHEVMDASLRKKREVWVPSKDEFGQPISVKEGPSAGEPVLRVTYEEVARIPSAIEKQIVDWAVQIAAGKEIEIEGPADMTDAQKNTYNMLARTLSDNKMKYIDQEILRLRSVYKSCVEIWYSEKCDPSFWGELGKPNSNFKMRIRVLSEETGDKLYPLIDSDGKMFGLGRAYIMKDEDDKDINKFDVFTSASIQTYTQANGTWAPEAPILLKYEKANFIYHSQDRVEWADIIEKRKRLEILDSNASDNNDATGSPILAISGKVEGFGKRGETGKVFELENGAKMDVIESAGAPEAIKFERDNLVKGIFDETATPALSITDAKGFGANIPGITLKLLFLPATLKAMSKQSGGWGMSIQRRFNFLLYAMAVINTDMKAVRDMTVQPKFGIYMPSNDTEEYENIVKLVGAGLLSRAKAIEMLKLVDKPEDELLTINAELDAAQLRASKSVQPITPTI
jgi:hypothetical protein